MENSFTSNSYGRLGTALLAFLIYSTISCTETVNSEYDKDKSCFTEESLKTIPWLRPILENFEKPKGGGYELILRTYHDQYFLVVSNPLTSSPMSYIFNCDGKNISDLGIGYEEFYDQAKFVAILGYVKPL